MEYHTFERRVTPCAEFPNDNPDLHHGAMWVCVELGREPLWEHPVARALEAPAEEEPHLEPATCGEPPTEPTEEIVSLLTNDGPAEEREAAAPCPSLPLYLARVDDLDADRLDEDAEPIEIVDDLSFDDDPADDPPPDSEAPCASERAPHDPFAWLVNATEDVARALGAGPDDVACLRALFGQSRLDGIAPGERAMQALLAGGVIAEGPRGIARSSGFASKVLAWQGILRGESEDFSLSDGGALEPLDEWVADVMARVLGTPARSDGIRRELRRRGIAAFGVVAEAA